MNNEETTAKGAFKSNRDEYDNYPDEAEVCEWIQSDPLHMFLALALFGFSDDFPKLEEKELEGNPMWSKMMAMMPIAAIMSTVTVPEEVKMEGDLQDELEKLLGKHLAPLKVVKNKKLHCTIDASYPEQSNLWTIFDGILQRYHLNAIIEPLDGTIGVRLEEGSAWSREE